MRYKDANRLPPYFLGNPLLLTDVLSTISDGSPEEFFSLSSDRSFEAGCMVFERGEPAENILVLRSGSARLLIHTNLGREKIARTITPGEVLGLVEAISGSKYDSSVETVGVCRFLVIGRRDFKDFLIARSTICFHLLQLLCQDRHEGRLTLKSGLS